jgi:membrane-anchored protein YejM (alkaline phosphatase superfamily)
MDHRDTARPFFGFLFYNALCGQSYPPQYQSLVSYPDTATSEQERFTRYTVALRYVDSLAGLVLEDLYKRGLSDKTVVIVTTDHGEEFNENGLGFTGHGTACSRAQTHVPLIVHWPGKPPSRISKRTSHNDIPATLMTRLFGCRNSPGDFCSGNDLFSEKQWEWLIVGSYYNYGIIEPEQVTIQFPGGYFEIRDTAYRIIEKPRVNRPVLTEAFREIGRFFNIK